MRSQLFPALVFACLTATLFGACAGPAPEPGALSPEALVARYVAAVNANDRAALQALYHPACLERVAGQAEDFLERYLADETGPTIPDDCEPTLEPVAELPAPPNERLFEYLVAPTHRAVLRFDLAEFSGVTLVRYLARVDSLWYFVLPTPTDEALGMAAERERRGGRG